MEIAMLHCGDSPHPAHQGFADAIGAEVYSLNHFPISYMSDSIPIEILNGLQLRGYDIYIAEGTRPLYGALINQIGSDSLLIYLAADQILYQLQYRSAGDRPLINRFISRHGLSALGHTFNRYIDGVITVSDFAATYTAEIIQKPIRIAHPYIQPELYTQLGSITPELDDKTAVSIGSYSWYKGQDILPAVWELVRQEHPQAELYLVGTGYPQKFEDNPGVTVCGYVDDLSEVLSKVSLYIHPARAEAFGVSVVEALRAGVPAIVTLTTGAASVIQSIDESFVTERSTESLANLITNYFASPVDRRRSLSKIYSETAEKFNSESCKSVFRNEFERLVTNVSA